MTIVLSGFACGAEPSSHAWGCRNHECPLQAGRTLQGRLVAHCEERELNMELRTRSWEAIDEEAGALWDLSSKIWSHPELCFEEHKAAEWLTLYLSEQGFATQVGLGDLPTAFLAEHPTEREGPTIALLAEYDALPELGHACGHNLIATIAVGAASGLARVKDELPGRLIVLGTPAEEGGSGKIRLIEQGLFKNVDIAMMVHPSNQTVVCRSSLAISELRLAFTGKPSHASSEPEKGINALDAVIQTFNGVNALRQHIADSARIHGIITDGGLKPNIVPDHASAHFYVRAEDNLYRDELLDRVIRCAEGAALATGASLSVEPSGHAYKALNPNPVLADLFRVHIERLGYQDGEHRGGMGSTDMGDVSWEVPAIHPYVKITGDDVAGHSREFAEASNSAEGRRAMLASAKALAATAIDVWTKPDLYGQVVQAYRNRRR